MKYLIGISLLALLYCSTIPLEAKKGICKRSVQWIVYKDNIDDGGGFILTCKYPTKIALADVVDNCRCFGNKLKYNNPEDPDPPVDSINTRQWCICMYDSSETSVDYLVSSWESIYKEQVTEQRETLIIGDLKAFQVIFKNRTSDTSFRHLIYFNKYSTLFEIINTNKATENDFNIFCKSIRIDKYSKPLK
ncbi:MAG: hypothetical protein Q8867_05790 [Bacteroidota bacterium]|nr:hypothetical protein [Bacteroidota bacterium]